ncbi:MAG: coiled-coil domain-containing protein [Planctomycetota bacterium]|jgi:hypothetical protein
MVSPLRLPRQSEETIELLLTVADPELVAELAAHREGKERELFALTALRIGILALRQARGRLDAETVRAESERLMDRLEVSLSSHRDSVSRQVASSLKEYFDPESGRFNERVERLVRKDGELERMLRRQVGTEDSVLAKTLADHLGESSPLMRVLSPTESRGILGRLGETLEAALRSQREKLLHQFSLDDKQSALSRLVEELSDRHGKLEEGLRDSIEEIVNEFSLDKEESALSRLVKRVEEAQERISSEFTLDSEESALARMRRDLLEVLTAQREANARFQEEVKTALAAMQARREEARRGTAHGAEFEEEVFLFLQYECQRAGEVATHTGHTTGRIKHCKVGDAVIELGPDSAASGAKIVVEAKEDASVTLAKAREEIETARKNRGAEVGLYVFSRLTAPEGLAPLARYGSDVFVVWDAEGEASDVVLSGGLSVARALCTRAASRREAEEADFESVERAIRAIEKQAEGLDDIKTYTETIRSSGRKILERSRIMRDALAREIETLDEKVGELKEVLGSAEGRE